MNQVEKSSCARGHRGTEYNIIKSKLEMRMLREYFLAFFFFSSVRCVCDSCM